MRIWRIGLSIGMLAICGWTWNLAYGGHAEFTTGLWVTVLTVILVVGPIRFAKFIVGLLEMVGAIG
jgi:hypothetical protein